MTNGLKTVVPDTYGDTCHTTVHNYRLHMCMLNLSVPEFVSGGSPSVSSTPLSASILATAEPGMENELLTDACMDARS